MPRHIEPLNGGLVTSKDPALLSEGQLSDIRNGVYKAASQALQRARGRTVFGVVTSVASAVVGLRDAKFDNADHYLIAGTEGGAYVTASVTGAGAFGVLVSGLGTLSQLERIHYRNRFFLLNGTTAAPDVTGTNRVIYLSATAANNPLQIRQHGMLPVISAPFVSTASGAFSQSVTGYYEYWTTEVAKITQDGAELVLESAFSAETAPTTVFVSATGVVPTVQMPTIQNVITTHWRIYRSPKKDKEADKKFPVGFMISEMATASATQADQSTVLTATSNPSAVTTLAYADFASASSGFTDNGVYASATVGVLTSSKQQGYYGHNFGGIAGSIRGIQVELQAYRSAGSATQIPLIAKIGKRNTVTDRFLGLPGNSLLGGLTEIYASKSAILTATATPGQTIVFGSSTDRWFPANAPGLADGDFSSNFLVVVGVSTPNTSIGLDYVKTTVHYTGTFDSVVQFPTVVYTFGDISAQVAKNGMPPSATTGDMYEDSMVCNDASNPALIRWSYPGEPEAFPPSYFIDFETAENDIVRLVKVVNNRLITALDGSIWRVNYLPSERDASFDRGKAIEAISRTFGVVNPMCACIYSPDGGTERLAFVSQKGIHSTDGFDFQTLADLDWRQVISLTSTSTAIALINDPEQSELLFYYRNDGIASNETYLCLHLSYDSDHIQSDGTLKASGPVHMRNFDSGSSGRADLKSAWTVPRISGDTTVFLGYGGSSTAAGAGKVYSESGTAIPAQDPAFKYTTRRMYLSGFANEWRLDEVYSYLSSSSGTQGLLYTAKNVKTDDDAGEVSQSSKAIAVAGRKLHHLPFAQQAEGLRLSMEVTAGHNDIAAEFLVLEGAGFGQQDSGK